MSKEYRILRYLRPWVEKETFVPPTFGKEGLSMFNNAYSKVVFPNKVYWSNLWKDYFFMKI